ncbi:hypothetical protein MNBD_DELTA04-585 [hydrothermal vent metagenome]|uniref:Membrane transporter protein n=1 Tax=hydrothermal vent metagenome TaxID=652676 RepID=A0A3B0VV14_9ZZZZ
MDTTILIVSGLSFGLSFLFALGGIGSAIALVPVLHWYGIPLGTAKPTGLFVNTLGMSGASYSNIRNKRLDFRMGIPLIISSSLLAPLGAWSTLFFSRNIVLIVFICFLVFCAVMMIFFKSSRYADQYREDRPVLLPSLIGAAAGFLSGLLGVGGGGLISPMMILLGFNPKKVAAITAFVVPFSSLIGFISYSLMGTADWRLLIPAALAAWGGGYAGTHFMNLKMKPKTVKQLLGCLLLLLAVKMIFML